MKSRSAEKLKELRAVTGLSIREVAKHLGYSHGSGYQHFEDAYSKEFLPYDLVQKLIPVFTPRGVEAIELLRLAGADFEPKADAENIRALIREIRTELESDIKPLVSKVEAVLDRLEKAAGH